MNLPLAGHAQSVSQIVAKCAGVDKGTMAGTLVRNSDRRTLCPQISAPDGHAPDDAFEAARAVFADKELADLTIAIGLMNAYNRLAISFRKTPQAVGES